MKHDTSMQELAGALSGWAGALALVGALVFGGIGVSRVVSNFGERWTPVEIWAPFGVSLGLLLTGLLLWALSAIVFLLSKGLKRP